MSLKKFQPNDLILNRMKAHPQCEFFIFDGQIYYNNNPEISGAFANNVKNVPNGFISLYEYNIDRLSGSNNFIYPFITKDSARSSFKTVGQVSYTNEFAYGDEITGSYPLSASITREYMTPAGERRVDTQTGSSGQVISSWDGAPTYRHYFALRNRLNYYGILSEHYKVTGSYNGTTYEWIKDQQNINLLSIPSIFYGSSIKKGTMSLKWYFTGSLAGELKDEKQNGELIQVGPAGSTGSGSVAGVVLYDEGFVLLTGSWALNGETIPLESGSTTAVSPSWVYFGAGAQDDVSQETTSVTSPTTPTPGAQTDFVSASFDMSFKGTTTTQVMTMFSHAKRGEVNYSNNPSFLEFGQDQIRLSSSMVYEENPDRVIKNTVSSSYTDFSASFKRQVYVSRVAIYDDKKNLIGVATLANPVLKKEDEDLTFKIRLDI